jgi:hypothetical protein
MWGSMASVDSPPSLRTVLPLFGLVSKQGADWLKC